MAKKKQTKKLTQKQLDYYRQLLIEKMQEILGDVNAMEENVFQGGGELSSMPVHLADIGTDSYEQEFSLGLMAEERKILVEIQQALGRIAEGTYGICEGLEIPIEENRLEAIPWTRYSLEYAKMLESGKAFDVQRYKARPIDIEREEEFDEEDFDAEEAADSDDTDDEEMQSLDVIDDEDNDDYEDQDIERQRDSA